MHCNSTSLCETLGSVRFILNDKTGTLTRNELQVRQLWVNGRLFSPSLPAGAAYTLPATLETPIWSSTAESERFTQLLRCVVACNSCVIENASLRANNPDEAALLAGVSSFGSLLLGRDDRFIRMRLPAGEETWSLETVLPFSSERKRMAVVARSPAGEIVVFAKVGLGGAFHPGCGRGDIPAVRRCGECGGGEAGA